MLGERHAHPLPAPLRTITRVHFNLRHGTKGKTTAPGILRPLPGVPSRRSTPWSTGRNRVTTGSVRRVAAVGRSRRSPARAEGRSGPTGCRPAPSRQPVPPHEGGGAHRRVAVAGPDGRHRRLHLVPGQRPGRRPGSAAAGPGAPGRRRAARPRPARPARSAPGPARRTSSSSKESWRAVGRRCRRAPTPRPRGAGRPGDTSTASSRAPATAPMARGESSGAPTVWDRVMVLRSP